MKTGTLFDGISPEKEMGYEDSQEVSLLFYGIDPFFCRDAGNVGQGGRKREDRDPAHQ